MLGPSAANLCVHMLCSKSLTYDHRKLYVLCDQVHNLLQNLCSTEHQSAAYRSVSLGNRKKLKFECSLELLLHPGTEHQFPPFKTFILHYYITTLSFSQNTATAQRESVCLDVRRSQSTVPHHGRLNKHTGNQLCEISQVLLLVH